MTPQEWQAATDEQHIKHLFEIKKMVDPRYINYLERERPHVVTQYLRLWQAQGSYMSPIAKRRLEQGK